MTVVLILIYYSLLRSCLGHTLRKLPLFCMLSGIDAEHEVQCAAFHTGRPMIYELTRAVPASLAGEELQVRYTNITDKTTNSSLATTNKSAAAQQIHRTTSHSSRC